MAKIEKYSYTRLSQYENCPFCYDLKYNQKKFISAESLVTAMGTLIHHIEEKISRSLREGKAPNYKDLIEELHYINFPKRNPYDTEGDIFGIEILKERFKKDYYAISEKSGLNYPAKVNQYIANIDRQEKFLLANPHLEIFDVEKPFEFDFQGKVLKGKIDRIIKYKNENKYQIYDIKTRDRLFEKEDITTPLQHVVYGMALKDMLGLEEEPAEYFYDLVFLQVLQPAGTKGFIKRGKTKLEKIFNAIQSQDYSPKPSPLCYWCDYSNTNPNVALEGQNLCPYYSLWTPSDRKNFKTKFLWEGPEKTEELINKLKEENKNSFRGFTF